jgi:hypothetical protein
MTESIKDEPRIPWIIAREIGVGEAAESGEPKDKSISRYVLAVSRNAPGKLRAGPHPRIDGEAETEWRSREVSNVAGGRPSTKQSRIAMFTWRTVGRLRGMTERVED